MASLSPTYLSQLFPNGLPQSTTSTSTAATAPNAPSTSAITDAIQQQLAPQFAQQDQAETEALANAGIVGGSTTGAMGALGSQQQTQLLGSIAPYIMQGYQLQQNVDFANQNAANNASLFNANANNANQQFNIADLIKSGMYDSTLQAQQEDTLGGFQNQDYLAQLGLQGNVITAGEGGQTGAYQPIYQQPAAPNFSGLGSIASSIGNGGQNGTPASSPYTNYSGAYPGSAVA